MPKNTSKIHKLSIFIFRRDLRLEDNTALFHSLRLSQQVVPCFVFDTDQIDPKKNSFFSNNSVQFMIESLKDLNAQLSAHKSRIFFFHGEKKAMFKHMLNEIKPDAVFINEDYTAYAKSRDNLLEKLCDEQSVKFYTYSDINLLPKDKVMLSGGQFYKKFTAYYNAAMHFPVPKPEHNTYTNYYPASKSFKGEYDYDDIDKFYEYNGKIEVHGGRKEGLKILGNIQKWKDYGKQRDCAAYPTTKLSAYNKFGCVSIREEYHIMKDNFGANCELIRQLFWRDFYHNVAYYNPHVFGDAFKDEYRNVYFSADSEFFDKWAEGKTGCPIVDAAMRQLNTTGYMTNRLRLITSNYLIKDLLIDWRKGEKYFAQHLVDYDPCNNNGNWQWSAGSGADAQPYFRIFNPKLQSEKFDKDCEYILKWVPELKGVEKDHIHHWEEHYKEYKGKVKYSDPIVFHDVQKKKCLKMYKQGLYGEKYEEEDDKEGIESENLGSIGEEEELEGEEEKKPSKKRKAQEPIVERQMKKNKMNSKKDVDEAMKEQEAKKVQLKIGEKREKLNARNKSQSHQKDKIKVNQEKKGKGKGKDKENDQLDENAMEIENVKGNGPVTRSRSKKVK